MIATESPTQVTALSNETAVESMQRTISASRLNTWLQCRLKFWFRYVQQVTKPPTPSLHIGSVVHLVLQRWNMVRWKRQVFDIRSLKQVFDVAWADQPANINWEEGETEQKTASWGLLETYFVDTPIKADELPEAVEVPVDADLSRHGLPTLVGVIDLVRSGGRIVDFKTSSKTPSPLEATHLNEAQMSCYSVLYREATGKREAGRELHHIVKTKQPKLVVTGLEPMKPSEQLRLFKLLDSYQEGLAREDFVPSPGFHCSGCEYLNECRSWC